MTPWIVTCQSGRAFIVYASDFQRAGIKFYRAVKACEHLASSDIRKIKSERITNIERHIVDGSNASIVYGAHAAR